MFFKISKLMFKINEDLEVINFIFDIFTKYSKDEMMNAKEIKEVFSVFRRHVSSEKLPKSFD